MAELRAGGLAIIVGGNPETLGVVVTTEKIVHHGERISLPDGRRFYNAGSTRWLVHCDRLVTMLSSGSTLNDYSFMFSHWLIPIDGDDFTHEDEREKELVNG
ncbi:hypothetical protein AO825_08335 [Pectobacterium brasiliense]|uniref:hypothetical protein n=1 Tax=Pectobacterium brasiliense TaxID=180957 RepID=UPI0001A444E3|nr:hypothetical protein [Pectobacterium brasiliense]KGA24920.1 hypothetical protein KS44_06315 [Pectobacterium brasiliense]KRF62858.1 hypothetical protein AO825_08335 [Pectobacterium brasiliense]MBN3186066.1 hypothetical protein [Pectobacterium brasiliense]QHG26898.1 hypothetical protein GT391_01870 [Pectobacterium brasiliense]